jgi:hypothetical protein
MLSPRKKPFRRPKTLEERVWDDVLPIGLIPVAASGPAYLLWELGEFLAAFFGG